jgi:hypothetical protein
MNNLTSVHLTAEDVSILNEYCAKHNIPARTSIIDILLRMSGDVLSTPNQSFKVGVNAFRVRPEEYKKIASLSTSNKFSEKIRDIIRKSKVD